MTSTMPDASAARRATRPYDADGARTACAPPDRSGRRPGPPAGPATMVAVGLALVGIGFWSTNAFAGSTALARLPLPLVTFLQFGSATVVLGMAKLVQRRRVPGPERPRLGGRRRGAALSLGVLGFTGTMLLQYVGFAHAPVVEANIIAYAWPMFAAVWMALTATSRSTLTGLGLALLGFAGVAVMILSQGGLSGSGNILGYGAALVSALCMAYYSLGSGRNLGPALDVMLFGGVAGTVVTAVWVCSVGVDWTPNWYWVAVLYTGLGPCAAGYLAWSAAMTRTQGRLAPLGYATPLLSTVVLIVAGRSLGGPFTVLGAALVLVCTIGVVINDRWSGRTRL